MIECSDEYIWYKKRKRAKRPKTLFAFFLILAIILLIFVYYKTIVTRQIFDICADYAYTYSATAVNDAVLTQLSDDLNYSDMIYVEKNNDGDVVMMTANSIKINLLTREIIDLTEKRLKNDLASGVPIPFFAFTGIRLISGYGGILRYKAINVSAVECAFSSDFKAVGINQTLHAIYVEVICTVNINAFPDRKTEICSSKVLLGESVIIGKVPETYLNGKLFG